MIDQSCRIFLCLWVDNVWFNFENYVVLVIFVRFLTQGDCNDAGKGYDWRYGGEKSGDIKGNSGVMSNGKR